MRLALIRCIRLCFSLAKSREPGEWTKAIFKPLQKVDDLMSLQRCRPITIISIACKICASLLNRRLVMWPESNGALEGRFLERQELPGPYICSILDYSQSGIA